MATMMTVFSHLNYLLLPMAPMEKHKTTLFFPGSMARLPNSPDPLWPWGDKHRYCFVDLQER